MFASKAGTGVVAIDKEKTLQAAQRAVEKKKYDLAIDEYRKLAVAEKNDPRWLLKIGDTQQKKGDFPSAIASYEEVARFYSAQGFHLKAVAVYNTVRDLLARQAPQLQTKYAHVPVKLAELYEKLQLTSDALATWDQIADRLQREGRDREATEIYRRIVSLDPSNPLAHLRLAEALSRQKDIEGAISEFAATAEQLTAQKRTDDALKVYERLLHHRQDPIYARPAAELYLQRAGPNDGVAAIAKIQICLKSDPKSVELIALLARGFVAIGQNDKAVTIYKESARLAGDQGKTELRRDIIKRLQQIAPGDDAVRALAAELAGGRAPEPERREPERQPERREPERREPVREVQQPAPRRPLEPPPPPPEPEELEDEGDLEVVEDDSDEVAFEEREAAEELSEINQGSMRARGSRVAEVIANADAFRKVKLYAKALTTLRIGLELDPRSVAIRERIRDILIETEETDLAISEMVTLAAILMEDSDLQGAYDNLAWILEADPSHPQAGQLYQQLQQLAGGEQTTAPEAADDIELQPGEATDRHRGQQGEFDELDEPLPSYDLEEADDPFGSVQQELPRGAVPRQEVAQPPAPKPQLRSASSSDELPAYELEEAEAVDTTADTGPSHGTGPSSSEQELGTQTAEVEAALEEADFYAAQGVFETARETIEEALRQSPQNRLLLEKLREIDQTAGGKSIAPPPSSSLSDRAFDIAASLDALDQVEPLAPVAPAHAEVDVEEVFAKFKLGVAQQIDEKDSATHYDLAIAYDQMMLYDDAIAEFKIAARDPKRVADCQFMMGMVHEKKGHLADATEAYKAGLHSEQLTQDEKLALLYQLGDVWERRKNKKEAAYYFRQVVSSAPNYRDGKRRLAAIEPAATSDKGSGARPKKDIDEELDAAFDEVMDRGKK